MKRFLVLLLFIFAASVRADDRDALLERLDVKVAGRAGATAWATLEARP